MRAYLFNAASSAVGLYLYMGGTLLINQTKVKKTQNIEKLSCFHSTYHVNMTCDDTHIRLLSPELPRIYRTCAYRIIVPHRPVAQWIPHSSCQAMNHTVSGEGHGAMARAWRSADVAACRAGFSEKYHVPPLLILGQC